MVKKVGRFCWRASAWSIRLFIFLILPLALLCALFVWRVNSAPLDIGFAKSYIESALRDSETGNYAVMEGVVLYWPDLTGPLYIELSNGQVMNKNGQAILSLQGAALSFSRIGLLSGRILPKSIIVKQPVLRLIRRVDGSFDFGFGANDHERKDEQVELTTRIFGYIARPGQEGARNSIISRLEAFRIENARLIVDDKIAQQSWSLPDFNAGIYSTQEGMKGLFDVQLPDVGLDESSLRVDLEYLWDQKNVAVSADVENVEIRAIADKVPELGMLSNQNVVLDAHIETLLDEKFLPTDVRLSITSQSGDFLHADMSDDPVPYTDLSLHAVYNYASKLLKIDETRVTLGEIMVHAQGEITHDEREVKGPVKLWIDSVEQSKIEPLWPKVLRGDNSEEWIVKKMSGGVFKDMSLDMEILAQKILSENGAGVEWVLDIKNVLARFMCENMHIDYRSPLDPAKGVYGSGTFDLNTDELRIQIDRGSIGTMDVSKANLLFDKVVAVGEGGADIDINFSDVQIADVMRFISKDPINLGDDLKMNIDQVEGNANLSVKLKFPTQDDVKMEDFVIEADATLNNILLPDVLEGLDLGGGPYKFQVKDGLAKMQGVGTLEKREVDLIWQRYLESKGKPFKEKVSAKMVADPNIRQILGIDLSEFIEGPLAVQVDYTSLRDQSAIVDVSVDGTPALFFVRPFDFAKKPGVAAQASFKAYFDKGNLQKISNLSAKGEGFSLDKGAIGFIQKDELTELSSGKIPYFVLGETRGTLEFAFDDAGAVRIDMNAERLDARPFMQHDENAAPYSEPPMQISVLADTVISAPDEAVYDARMYMDIDKRGRFNHMEADARVGKKGKVKVRFKPDNEGKRTFYMKTNNAGALLKAFHVYNNIRGGTMVIYGEPSRGIFDRNINGKAEMTDFKVVDAPALTKILSILSLTGITDALSNDGLKFDKLESDFKWLYRAGGSVLAMENGRTSGNSLGLLFEGIVDNKKREVNISGTVVPMDGLNKVLEKIPLVGDILTGGTGGIFAATYTVTGSTDAPEISVNPLSVLTPGIIRRVLFE
ncbi:MAG: AsmA-like C-terminal domain-containing protein [Alphaproteobacteria bacterium]